MPVKETGSQARRLDRKNDPREKEKESGDRTTVEGGTARSGLAGSTAAGKVPAEPDTIGSTIPTKRVDGSTRRGEENEGETGRGEN